MKKTFQIFLVLSLLFSFFLPVYPTYATASYFVKTVDSNGTIEEIGTYPSYEEAKKIMQDFEATDTKLAVIYNASGILVNAQYALVDFSGHSEILLYQNPTDKYRYTYIDGNWGSDGEFLGYDPSTDMIKVKISGFVGWTKRSNATIVPLSTLYANYVTITDPGSHLPRVFRKEPSTSSEQIQSIAIPIGEKCQYFETVNDGTYTWYRITYAGYEGWIASKDSTWTSTSSNIGLKTYYKVTSSSNLYHYYRAASHQYSINLGPAPSFLEKEKEYYSFDGNYFYTNLKNLLLDDQKETHENAVNASKPYYNYYMYLPTHYKTGYTAEDFDQVIKDYGFIGQPDPTVRYVDEQGNFIPGINRSGISTMYGQGIHFIEAQNTFGVNALMAFGVALNESGRGTSAISFAKNNIFGLGAYDSCVFSCALSFDSVAASIAYYAKLTGSKYSDPRNSLYYGSHYGNKGSGMGVNYASDPYWGEKQAQGSFLNDRSYGGKDYKANTIGVKTSTESIPVYKEASSTSTVLYNLKNAYHNYWITNLPLIVIDKVDTIENGKVVSWYKVYTDIGLDEKGNLVTDFYNFSYSYGYVKADYLYVENTQPTIQANNVTIKQYEEWDPLSGVTATDLEDGDVSKNLTYEHTIDFTKVGDYPVVYRVHDENNFYATKTIIVTVIETDYPVIEASDQTVSQKTEFDYKKNVSAHDKKDGDITDKITYSGVVNTDTIGTYEVTYSVTNSFGKTTTKTITVTVLKNQEPVIYAENKVLTQGEHYNPLDNVQAIDFEDGNITDRITYEDHVDIATPGVYTIRYTVTDNAGNTVSKEISVTVNEKVYIQKDSLFHLESMLFNESTEKLEFKGFFIIKGIPNTKEDTIQYDLLFENQTTGLQYTKKLSRLENPPFEAPSEGGYDYSGSWFFESVDLTYIPEGDYTLYIRARSLDYEAKEVVKNVFFNTNVSSKFTTQQGRGYQLKSNYYSSLMPLELFIRDKGLISSIIPPTNDNMFNQYYQMEFLENTLHLVGTSHSVGGNYSVSASVEREIYIVDIKTLKTVQKISVGSLEKGPYPVSLRVEDGFSKDRAWYEVNIPLNGLEKGTYAIYIRTKTDNAEDYGELNDILFTEINQATIYQDKVYKLRRNDEKRFRIELIVE